MEIEYIQQLGVGDLVFNYQFNGEMITVTIDDQTDIFDFTSFLDGEVNYYEIETTLPFNPVVSAKRENSVLTVTLLDWGEGNG